MTYPYTVPLILTDEIFTMYGGLTGTSTPSQRLAAYQIAEQQMTEYLKTFLLPTIVTGSLNYDPYSVYASTEFGYVQKIHNLRVLNPLGEELWNISGTTSYSYIYNDTFGYVRYRDLLAKCGMNVNDAPVYLELTYEAGLPTGVASQPPMLMALSMAAQISLNELVFPFSNEGSADVGITEFESLEYKEKRKPWKNTAFGASVKAAKVAQLVDSTMKKARKSLVIR